jgi:phage-related protein
MSNPTYSLAVRKDRKPLVILRGEIKTPPFSKAARIEVGTLLRRLQEGEMLGLPQSRPMPSIGHACHELRVRDKGHDWRIAYRLDAEAVVVVEIFSKSSRATPQSIIEGCKRRLRLYDDTKENLKK